MPWRSRTATLDGRPSSSSGPGSGRVSDKPKDFDKRKSRDDLYLMTMTAEKQRYKSFHVPNRSRLPSLDSAGVPGRTEGLRGTTTVTVSAGKPVSAGKQSDSGVIAIGMALGSPTQTTGATGWQPQLASIMSPSAGSEAQESQDDSSSKPKSRKWGLFRSKSKSTKRGRANTDTISPQAKMDTAQASIKSPPAVRKPSEPRQAPPINRSGSAAVNSAKHKPIVVRSNTEPVISEQTVARPSQPNRAPPKPPLKSVHTTPARHHERPTPAGGFHLPKSRGPLLDVEIPDITMERYSIMFGQVLQKKQSVSDASSSSLLARRQATLGKLKNLGDETPNENHLHVPRPRRATSPQPKESPAFHLFPVTPKKNSATPRSPRHHRSNTSPAGLPSPAQASFDPASAHTHTRPEPPRAQTYPRTVHANHSAERLPGSASSMQRRPSLVSKFQRPASGSLPGPKIVNHLFDSPTSLDEKPIYEMKATYTPNVNEPWWEMISPPNSQASSMAGTPKKGSLSSIVSAEQISVIKQAEKQVEGDPEAEKALREAVEASITRQISVSRDQRHLLGSLKGQPRKRKDSKLGTVAVGENERLVETKKSTPTLVVPEAAMASGHRGMHMHRKSEQVVVEGA